MYFGEMLSNCDIENVICIFLGLCTKSPNINLTEERIRNALRNMLALDPVIDNDKILVIETVQAEVESYEAVRMLDTKEGQKYGIEVNPWSDTLGYTVDVKSLDAYGIDKFAALVLWEMTWFGYSEDVIQEKAKSWDE